MWKCLFWCKFTFRCVWISKGFSKVANAVTSAQNSQDTIKKVMNQMIYFFIVSLFTENCGHTVEVFKSSLEKSLIWNRAGGSLWDQSALLLFPFPFLLLCMDCIHSTGFHYWLLRTSVMCQCFLKTTQISCAKRKSMCLLKRGLYSMYTSILSFSFHIFAWAVEYQQMFAMTHDLKVNNTHYSSCF